MAHGRDLRRLPLIERKRELRRLLPRRSRLIETALCIPRRGRDLFHVVQAHGLASRATQDLYREKRASLGNVTDIEPPAHAGSSHSGGGLKRPVVGEIDHAE